MLIERKPTVETAADTMDKKDSGFLDCDEEPTTVCSAGCLQSKLTSGSRGEVLWAKGT